VPTNPLLKSNARLRGAIGKLRQEFIGRLAELVAIPSVSMDPERAGDVRRCAEVACGYLRELGAEAEVRETAGLPLVVGRLVQDQTFPTVTVYNHLDVQPADGDGWKSPPFHLTPRGDRHHGRGATDDKGPLLAGLYGARLALASSVRLNFQFLWECEEEIGSPSFAAAVAALAKGHGGQPRLRTDSVVVSDNIWPCSRQPAVAYGLRGLVGFIVRLRTADKDVHSGTTGGAARNPVAELAALLAECHDARTGRVRIPGFYDPVRAPSASERRELERAGLRSASFRKAHGLKSLRVADDRALARAIMTTPTFEVHGIVGGYSGPGVKTIVPHEAEAKVSCRLVPGQRPRDVFRLVRRFIAQKCPDAQVVFESALEPYLADTRGPFLQAAVRATRQTFGKQPALTREGGSIGAVVTLSKILRKEVVLLGLSLPEDGYHAVNESFAWPQAAGGIEVFCRYFHELANIRRQP
jgi:acetylornithine deacetylase/succinyl-diaminopimelate desuccinylase-like protein